MGTASSLVRRDGAGTFHLETNCIYSVNMLLGSVLPRFSGHSFMLAKDSGIEVHGLNQAWSKPGGMTVGFFLSFLFLIQGLTMLLWLAGTQITCFCLTSDGIKSLHVCITTPHLACQLPHLNLKVL